ncbi:MAG: twin-arginine translocase subunit TatB [Nitrosomonadaceae bacterium]|nr:twin-arginine translocase subunit TatB [Nitrosomonadaceae bacterium]
MFDISFTEIMVIIVITLIVVGPDRLPKLARTLGYLLGRLHQYISGVKNDIQREMAVDELNKLDESVQKEVHSLENSVLEEADEFETAENSHKSTVKTSKLHTKITREEVHLTESISSPPSSDSIK